MTTQTFQFRQIIEFTKTLDGVCHIDSGDLAIYLGNSQAKILTGKSKNWVVCLDITAPVVAYN